MKALISAAFAAAFLLSGPALADEAKQADQNQPIQLTAAQMDTVTAGAGRIAPFGSPNANSGIPPWSALIGNAGFSATQIDLGDPSGISVLVPR